MDHSISPTRLGSHLWQILIWKSLSVGLLKICWFSPGITVFFTIWPTWYELKILSCLGCKTPFTLLNCYRKLWFLKTRHSLPQTWHTWLFKWLSNLCLWNVWLLWQPIGLQLTSCISSWGCRRRRRKSTNSNSNHSASHLFRLESKLE